ncbi:MAG: VCBS repeat-containing protein, partial [Opitutales bacterium]|nr:VCBS repeat-containing protein [Opitutales bacterium]
QLGNPWSAGSSLADIDNDGDLDLYVCNYEAANQLFLNNGKGHFTEVGTERGLDLLSASLMGYFCDYDLDGDLDLYVLCNRLYREGGRPAKPPFHMVGNKPEVLPEYRKHFGFELVMNKMHKIITIGRPDRLYKNDGKGFFTDVTAGSGIADIHRGLSATWFDYDGDGYPDLFVANDMNDVDQFYRNNRDGTFTNVTQGIVPHTTWFSMGADIADINNDGLIDYFCVDMAGTTHFLEKTTMGVMSDRQWFVENNRPTQYMWNTMFLNTGSGRFLEAAYLTGLAKSDWSWAPKFADFDNDGWIDLFITNGMSRNFTHSDMPLDEKWLIGREEFDIYKKTPVKKDQNLAFRNDGNLHFTRQGKEWGLDHFGMSFSAALADLDQDGNPDLVVANQEEPVHIYRNTSVGNRISLNLIGRTSNRFGVGAKVDIETEIGMQTRYLNPYTGYLSSNEPVLHFGLGKSMIVRKLTVHWPGRAKQVLLDLPANRHYTIREAKAAAGPSRPSPAPPTPMFVGSKIKPTKHQETKFDDYKRQPLLPYKHSQLGPGTAIGDIDGDGLEDLFFGGAKGQTATILIQQKQGGFKPLNSDALEKDKEHEDMGALILDFNGDGNLDLFVVSGGVECQPGDPVLQDRMYLNKGGGNLARAPEQFFPSQIESGSIAAACDFDRDGDLDLFVGSRVIPGKYPLSPNSHLYINEGSHFKVATH